MLIRRRFTLAATVAGCCLSLAACAWPFGTNGPKDIRVVSVSEANFKDQTQLEYADQKPRPSIPLSRIDFSTDTDLLALARKHQYNITFAIGPCSKDGVVDNGTGFGYVYWGTAVINAYTKDSKAPGYAEAVAKGPPFTYQVYARKLPPKSPAPLCIALRGGNMLGGKLRSNDAAIPAQP